ncbi:MAG: hypothetical protein CVU00_06370 [Bacteroidetes bacterium HGW-Bacteroidetes-17]|jgi:hypothetical protein|nr:MAG: hypothetical protein CVU00_06370 [Bacteroidetes bacterium HGW-Bacteroidetes-17]
MQKKIKFFLIGVFILIGHIVYSQNWQILEEGQVIKINNIELSFIATYAKEAGGQDVYEITATLNNMGSDYISLFENAVYEFVETPKNAWTQLKFSNASGKGLSAKEGFIYPDAISMRFPFKCNPEDKNQTWESRIIGVGLRQGQFKTKEWRIRVEKGKPKVMVFNKF